MYNSRFILKSFKENNKSTRKNHRTLKKILAYAKVLNVFLSVVQFTCDTIWFWAFFVGGFLSTD